MRLFLLRPSAKVNQILRFCLAVAAQRTGVLIHAYGALSDHVHAVVTDVHGNLPDFMGWFDEFVAKCVNVELGRWGSFWESKPYSRVHLVDEEDVLRRLCYTCTNPVSAFLVRSARDWPGAISLPEEMGGEPQLIERPEGFFRKNGPVPESCLLQLTVPPQLERHGEKAIELVRQRIDEKEQALSKDAKARGKRFLGRLKVLTQSPFGSPDSKEKRRGLDPRVAAHDKWRRIETLQRLKAFLQEDRDAWRRFVAGETDVVFPYGTYLMRIRFGVLCSGP